ncbi:MAG: DMT family transporter [Chloroflexota bacterium]|nr:DMT family transporter [Chloroflexota bacterium]
MDRRLLIGGLLVIIWSWTTIFITMLSDDFDVITQNFFRYSSGSLFLLFCTMFFWRSDFLAASRRLPLFLIPAVLVFAFQLVWVKAIYLTTPTISVLVSKLDLLFIALLAAVFFGSERRIVTSKWFILGAALGLLGVMGVMLGRGDDVDGGFTLGIILLLVRCCIWGVYTILLRWFVTKVEPVIAATWVFLIASVLFLPTVLIWGDIGSVTGASIDINIILFGSGALCVGLGNALNYTSIKQLGPTVTTSLLLLTPFIAGIISFFICDETLTMVQVISGVLILIGCWVILRGQRKTWHDHDKDGES